MRQSDQTVRPRHGWFTLDRVCGDTSQRLGTSRRCGRRRGGWTLIEMLVTISVMGVLTGISVKTLSTMLRSERAGVEHVAGLNTVSRLARQFRLDIHAASSVEVNSETPTKPLILATLAEGHQIQYEIQPLGLLRTERRPNQPPINELWRLKQTRFQCLEAAGPPRILTLVIGTLNPTPVVTTGPPPTLKEIRIEAVAGRDR